MIITLFRYLFRAINSHIITILNTVYHFIAFFRYINNLPDSPQVLNKLYLFSMKNLLKIICFTSSSQFKQKLFVFFLLCIQFYSALMDLLNGTFSCRKYS